MKVFLTGGTGVIGTRALPALVAAGHWYSAQWRYQQLQASLDADEEAPAGGKEAV